MCEALCCWLVLVLVPATSPTFTKVMESVPNSTSYFKILCSFVVNQFKATTQLPFELPVSTTVLCGTVGGGTMTPPLIMFPVALIIQLFGSTITPAGVLE